MLQFDKKKLAKCRNKNKFKNEIDYFNNCLTVVCNFLQCDYCQIGNVSMNFSSPLVTENSFQITRRNASLWKRDSQLLLALAKNYLQGSWIVKSQSLRTLEETVKVQNCYNFQRIIKMQEIKKTSNISLFFPTTKMFMFCHQLRA